MSTHPLSDLPGPEQDKLVNHIMKWLKVANEVEKLTDAQLADAVVADVWAKMFKLGTREEALLDEMIKRFEAKSGIERDDEGEIISKSPEWKS